jgi:hypothetical protein
VVTEGDCFLRLWILFGKKLNKLMIICDSWPLQYRVGGGGEVIANVGFNLVKN